MDLVLTVYLAVPIIALAGPVVYLGYSPNYTVGASTLMFFPFAALLGMLCALTVFARGRSSG